MLRGHRQTDDFPRRLREHENGQASWTEMVSKIEGALQELEESMYWLELLTESGIVKPELLSDLIRETDELTAILVTRAKTINSRRRK